MRPTLNYLSAACAASLLLACGAIAPPAVAPTVGAHADEAFLRGRAQQMAGDAQQARVAYAAALAAAPGHARARNGLATLFAEQGKLDEAIAMWRQLTEPAGSGAGPDSAYLYSNLGYAYLLRGDIGLALPALERACLLDPFNHQAWRHLGSALEQLGQPERAAQVRRQALALETHDLRRDYMLTGQAGPAAVAQAVRDAAPAQWPEQQLRETESGIFELRRSAARAPAAAVPAVPMDSASAARLEIRNGNGVTGMARSLARSLGEPGMRIVRLTNQKGFRVARTRIEYQGDFLAAATKLAERFEGATVQEVHNCRSSNLRLVIGRDLIVSELAARRAAKAALAAAGPGRQESEAG
ncbi:MAG: tetratricopeptide repeat protein [Massilia sp.]